MSIKGLKIKLRLRMKIICLWLSDTVSYKIDGLWSLQGPPASVEVKDRNNCFKFLGVILKTYFSSLIDPNCFHSSFWATFWVKFRSKWIISQVFLIYHFYFFNIILNDIVFKISIQKYLFNDIIFLTSIVFLFQGRVDQRQYWLEWGTLCLIRRVDES